MTKLFSLSVAVLAVVLLPALSLAQPGPQRGRGGPGFRGPGGPGGPGGHGPGAMFDRVDKNKDGAITADELPKEAPDFVKEMLKKADKDGDKKVTKEEIQAAIKARMAAHRGGRGRGPGPGGPAARGPGRPGQGPPAARGPQRRPVEQRRVQSWSKTSTRDDAPPWRSSRSSADGPWSASWSR